MKSGRAHPGTLDHFFLKAAHLGSPASAPSGANPSRSRGEAAASAAAASAPLPVVAGAHSQRQPAGVAATHSTSASLGLTSHGEDRSCPAEPPQPAAIESFAAPPAECAARHSVGLCERDPMSPPAAPAAAPDSPDSSLVAIRHVRRVCLSPESSPDMPPAVTRNYAAPASRPGLGMGAFSDPAPTVAALGTAAAPLSADDSQRQLSVACTLPPTSAESAPSLAAGASPTGQEPLLRDAELAPEPEVAAESRASPARSPERWRRTQPRPGTLAACLVRPPETEEAAVPAAPSAAEGTGPDHGDATGSDARGEGGDEDGAATEPAWLPPAKRRRGLFGCVCPKPHSDRLCNRAPHRNA